MKTITYKKRVTCLIFFLFSFISFSQHTFSIVAVDPATGEIGSAGATCLGFEGGALEISDIVLNVGAIHTQAWWTIPNQNAARARMEAGDSPDEIISWLQANDNPSGGGNITDRQYGVVDLNGGDPRSAAFTGSNNYDQKGHRTGSNYAIQGNILISQDVLDDMETAFLNTPGPLCDRLMAVMQAAKRPGADSRCLADGISSESAFIRVAKPTDTDSSYGNLWLDINVWLDSGTFTGDPIDELQIKFDEFKNNLSLADPLLNDFVIYPNPTESEITITSTNILNIDKLKVLDLLGKEVFSISVPKNVSSYKINLEALNSGLYLVKFYNKNGLVKTSKIVMNKQ